MRHVLLAIALTLPALVALVPPVPAAPAIDPQAWEAELLIPPIGQKSPFRLMAFYSDVAWHPKGDYALIVGGIRGPSHNPCHGWSLIMAYDGKDFRVVHNQTGCMLTRLDWHPDGLHAIVVGERNTILKVDGATSAVKDLWGGSVFARAGEHFLPRNVAYRPNGQYALITGNDILRYYPEWAGQEDVLAPGVHGTGDFYDAVAWSPDSRYAILETGIERDDGVRALGAVSFWSEDAAMCTKNKAKSTPCLYTRALYGRYDPGFTDIDGIVFPPIGKVAFIHGLDGGTGTIMRYLEQEDIFNFPFSYENPNGRLTTMAFQPQAFRILYTSEGDNQLVMSESWKFKTLLTNEECKKRWPTVFTRVCPNLKDAAWHPDGRWALIISGSGWIFRFVPKLEAAVEITTPTENSEFSGNLSAKGRAYSTQLTRNITHVQVRVDDGEWRNATLHSKVNMQIQWNLTVPLSGLAAGSRHFLHVRATEDGGTTWGPEGTARFYVKATDPTQKHATLQLRAPDGTTVKNGFNLTWDAVGDAHYVVERSNEPTFLEPHVVYTDNPRLRFPAHAKGDYWFRVAALGGLFQGDWSNSVKMTVTEGPAASARGSNGTIPPPQGDTSDPPPNGTGDTNSSGGPQVGPKDSRPAFGIPLPLLIPVAAGGLAAWSARRRN